MLVVTYDVDTADAAGQKRLRKVARICERHGTRVQNSVFEVLVDAAGLAVLKRELEKVIDMEQDSVRFYRLGNLRLYLSCQHTTDPAAGRGSTGKRRTNVRRFPIPSLAPSPRGETGLASGRKSWYHGGKFG